MDTQTLTSRRRQKVWLDKESGKIDAFKELVAQATNPHEWPLASGVVKNVLIYDGSRVREIARDPDARLELMAEWVEAFSTGPGVIVIKRAIADLSVIDRATEVFNAIVKAEKAGGRPLLTISQSPALMIASGTRCRNTRSQTLRISHAIMPPRRSLWPQKPGSAGVTR